MSHDLAEDSAEQSEMQQKLEEHYESVLQEICEGQIIFFLGAGVNLCNRPEGMGFTQGRFLPNGRELAEIMATEFNYPWKDKENLLRVSWYAALSENGQKDSNKLYRYLYKIFNDNYPSTDVHTFLAKLPRWLRRKKCKDCYQIIVTTNYDDVLERTFRKFKEPFDVVHYVAVSEDERLRGKFLHIPYIGEPKYITNYADYDDLPIDEDLRVHRTLILKIHGAVDRGTWTRCSFVVTEDDYIDYLAHLDLSKPLPKMLEAKMKYSSFLFLGYSLADWNLRVILHRIWGTSPFSANSWAIMDKAEEPDEKFWKSRSVDFMKLRLDNYIAGLRKKLGCSSFIVRE